MSNPQTTIVCDLSGNTIVIDGPVAALRERIGVLLQNHDAYDESLLVVEVSYLNVTLETCETFVEDGEDLRGEIELNSPAILARFEDGRLSRRVREFDVDIREDPTELIAAGTFPVMNNPFDPDMEAPTEI